MLAEPLFIVFGVGFYIAFDLVENVAVKIFLAYPFFQIKHRVDLAPIFAAFPDLNRGSAHLFGEVD